MIYFFDTYALVELIRGSKNYEMFSEVNFRTTILNLYELYYSLLKDYNEDIASKYFNKFFPFIINVRKDHIFYASKFRLSNTKKDISYIDALGYAIAKLDGYKFLTGDKAFEFFDNVEFVN